MTKRLAVVAAIAALLLILPAWAATLNKPCGTGGHIVLDEPTDPTDLLIDMSNVGDCDAQVDITTNGVVIMIPLGAGDGKINKFRNVTHISVSCFGGDKKKDRCKLIITATPV